MRHLVPRRCRLAEPQRTLRSAQASLRAWFLQPRWRQKTCSGADANEIFVPSGGCPLSSSSVMTTQVTVPMLRVDERFHYPYFYGIFYGWGLLPTRAARDT